MKKKVLIVDDNQEMLLTLKEGLERYQDDFSVLIAGDGRIAIEKLRKHWVSLIITDLKMPNISGLDLLVHIKQFYPEIPVFIITGYSTASIEEKLVRGGAAEFLEKPFQIKTLACKIKQTLHQHYNGGVLNNVSPGMFTQLIEMEQKTCTIRVTCQNSGKAGVLFFQDGNLMDARISDQRGNNAAYDIFSWDQVTLVIENACGISTPTIKSDLQSILLEALKRKDEKDSHPIVNDAKPKATIPAPSGNEISVKSVWEKLKRTRGDKYLDDVYQDESWNPFITQLKKLGESTGAGELKIAYVNQDESTDCFLIPKKHPIIIRADAKCPRDQIIRSLSN